MPYIRQPALRRHIGGSIIKILVVGFKKAEVDLVQLVVIHLLRKLLRVGSCIGAEQDSVLVLFKKCSRSPWLTA